MAPSKTRAAKLYEPDLEQLEALRDKYRLRSTAEALRHLLESIDPNQLEELPAPLIESLREARKEAAKHGLEDEADLLVDLVVVLQMNWKHDEDLLEGLKDAADEAKARAHELDTTETTT